MQHIDGMHVDGQDRLVVFDHVLARFTVFTDLGTSSATTPLTGRWISSPDPILSLGDSFVIRYLKQTDDPPEERSALHLHDAELNTLESFAQLGSLFDLDIPVQKSWSNSGDALNVATNGSDRIVLAPQVYGGLIYRYTRRSDAWVMDTLQGGPAP